MNIKMRQPFLLVIAAVIIGFASNVVESTSDASSTAASSEEDNFETKSTIKADPFFPASQDIPDLMVDSDVKPVVNLEHHVLKRPASRRLKASKTSKSSKKGKATPAPSLAPTEEVCLTPDDFLAAELEAEELIAEYFGEVSALGFKCTFAVTIMLAGCGSSVAGCVLSCLVGGPACAICFIGTTAGCASAIAGVVDAC
jgi:hypothetical protein